MMGEYTAIIHNTLYSAAQITDMFMVVANLILAEETKFGRKLIPNRSHAKLNDV